MTDDHKLLLDKTLSLIDQIVIDLPKIRSRREMKMISGELVLLTESARRKVQEMEREMLTLKHEYCAKRFDRQKGIKRG